MLEEHVSQEVARMDETTWRAIAKPWGFVFPERSSSFSRTVDRL